VIENCKTIKGTNFHGIYKKKPADGQYKIDNYHYQILFETRGFIERVGGGIAHEVEYCWHFV
jgi:hypothetical protein